MKMQGFAHQTFVEADLAYRREQAAATFRHRPRKDHKGWTRRLREAMRNKTDLRGGAPLPGADRSMVQPNGWESAAYIRPVASPHH
jgi:hypothetical protein